MLLHKTVILTQSPQCLELMAGLLESHRASPGNNLGRVVTGRDSFVCRTCRTCIQEQGLTGGESLGSFSVFLHLYHSPSCGGSLRAYKFSSEHGISDMEVLTVFSHSKGKLSYVIHQNSKIFLEPWLCARHWTRLCGWGDEWGISVFEKLTIIREIIKHY